MVNRKQYRGVLLDALVLSSDSADGVIYSVEPNAGRLGLIVQN